MEITIDWIESLGPCPEWTRARMEKVARGRRSMTPLEFSRMRSVPVVDRLWVLLHEPVVSRRGLRHFACDCAERALRREERAGREPDQRSWEAVRVARLFVDGQATTSELTAAYRAVDAIAWNVAMAIAASWSAAEGASRTASRAARAAARAAAGVAAGDAAQAAAMKGATRITTGCNSAQAAARAEADERRWQLRRLRKYFQP